MNFIFGFISGVGITTIVNKIYNQKSLTAVSIVSLSCGLILSSIISSNKDTNKDTDKEENTCYDCEVEITEIEFDSDSENE